jgi:hypothetical protein
LSPPADLQILGRQETALQFRSEIQIALERGTLGLGEVV